MLQISKGTIEKYKLSALCFIKCLYQASNKLQEDNSTVVTITVGDAGGLLCHVSVIVSSANQVSTNRTFNFLMLMTIQIHINEYWGTGEHVVTFDAPSSEAETWDIIERGPRLFVYPVSPETITYNLAATLALFEPVLSQGVVEMFAVLNRDFLRAFVGLEMEPRDVNGEESQSILDEVRAQIKNGDTFNIMRLDGLDPMIAWAMGASTGHTGMCLYTSANQY